MKRVVNIILMGLLSACSAKQVSVSLKWEMGDVGAKEGYYANHFTLYNTGSKALEANWTIYYSQMPRSIVQDSTAQVKIECLGSDYFKMSPTQHYQSVAAGDSLVVEFFASNDLIKTSHAPSGAFIVFTKGGKEAQPEYVPLQIMPLTQAQYDNPLNNKPPYPYGDIIYAQNERITPKSASPTEILPTPKIATFQNNGLTLQSVILQSDDEFNGEAEFLARQLPDFNIKEDQNGVVIRMKRFPSGFKTRNDEHYRLKIAIDTITIEGNTPQSVFYGGRTLTALLRNGENRLPFGEIEDYPDLAYRGIMLDVARNFIPKENLLKFIDLFSQYKINTLHLHATDDEGWRIEIPGLEELTTVGARRGYADVHTALPPAYGSGYSYTDPKSPGNGYYSREDFMDILRYAAQRHITVIPEFDLPGHSRAAIRAMNARYAKYVDSDLDKATEYLLWDFADTSRYESAQNYTDNVLCVALESSYNFIDKVVGEVAQMYKDAGLSLTTFNIGGDEVPDGAWAGSVLCAKLMTKEGISDVRALNPYFFNRVVQILQRHDIPVSGWQELAMNHDGSVNEKFRDKSLHLYCWNTVPEWGGDIMPYILANAGYHIVLSNVTNLYFDLAYTNHKDERGLYWGGFNDEVTSFALQPFHIYRSVRKNLRGEEVDVLAAHKGKVALKPEARANIAGIQGQQFQENTPLFEYQSYALFPKIFGLVERGWNAEPEWADKTTPEAEKSAFYEALSIYYANIFTYQLPYLISSGFNVRINPPGIKVENGKLYANNLNPKAETRYTLDGSEPTKDSPLWSAPVNIAQDERVKAKSFFMGKESTVSLLKE